MSTIQESIAFFRQFRTRFETTGAVLPSSRFLARAMTSQLRERSHPLRVLEIGPGTGAVTRHIVDNLQPGDRFDLVEINDAFAELIRRRFETDPRYQHQSDQAEIHVCPLQEFATDEPYDVIISGLPFNNFTPGLVDELLEQSWTLLADGGDYCFFEYMYVRPLRSRLSRGEERQRLQEIERVIRSYLDEHTLRRDSIFVNVPPAWVQHLHKAGGELVR